jgi:hypothetical protein
MNCPFCGIGLSQVAAICPSCKSQLPEAKLIAYYAAAIARDRSMALPENRNRLDSIVKKEAVVREKLLNEARERAKIEEDHARAESMRRSREIEERFAAEAAEARLRRSQFFERNRKKLIAVGIATTFGVGSLVATIILLQPEKIPVAVPKSEQRSQPCVALGNAAKQSNILLNKTLDDFRDSGLSGLEISALGESAKDIQSELFSSTIGQANDLPEVEGSILIFSNSLGAFGRSLVGLNSESMILSKATGPVHEAAKNAQQICISSGFKDQFNNASGWE